jgi:hypothetical protein
MNDEDIPRIEDMDTKQLMSARMIFETMLTFLKSTEFPLEESTPQNIQSIEREIAEIDVELLSRDYD